MKKLREAEVLQGRGNTVYEIRRKLGISDVTYIVDGRDMVVCRWIRACAQSNNDWILLDLLEYEIVPLAGTLNESLTELSDKL